MELKTYYLISGPYIIFAFIYLIYALFSFIRLKDVFELRGLYKISMFFYFSATFICFLRIFDFTFIALLVPGFVTYGNQNTVVTGLLYFTDTFFWIVFIILIFRLIHIFYEGHVSEENSPFMRIIKPISTNFIIMVIFSNLLIEIILTALLSFGALSSSQYILQIAILNIILPSVLIFIEIYLHLKYSGAPYISILASDNKGILNKSVIIWGLGRAYHGCWSMYLSQVKNMYEILNKSEQEINDNFQLILVNMSLIIVDIILTELLPLFVCYDINFAKAIFSMHNSGDNLLERNNNNIINKVEVYSIDILSNFIISYSDVKFPDLLQNVNLKKKNGFGNLSIITYQNINYLGRVITLKGFTPYVMEEFFSDLIQQQEISKFKNINFRPVKFYCTYNSNNGRSLLFLSEYYPNGSLRNLLNKQGTSFKVKIRMALDIAKCIDDMHQLQPPIIHGHLNINNVILDNEFKILIDGIFFIALKKYYTLNSNYCYKTVYTAPEFLLDANRFIFKPTLEGDIYSLGMIFYEIFTENKPFNGFLLKELTKKVSAEKSRPKIQDNILSSKLANLIRCCWQDEPLKRPNSSQVVQVLNNMID